MTIDTSFYVPNAKQQFFNGSGQPLANGTVYMYVPGTTTPKTTWLDPYQTTPNSDPITLDSNGMAQIYGTGDYRQQVYDSSSNLIWDQTVQSGGNSGLLLSSNNLSDLPSASTARANLGLSSLGTLNIGAGLQSSGGNLLWDFTTEATLASNTTTDLGTANSNVVKITGTTTITSFGSSANTNNPLYFIRFTGILTLTYNAATLVVPGASNITTAAGDAAIAKYEGSGNWRVIFYQTAAGTTSFLKASNNLSDVANVTTAVANLGGPFMTSVFPVNSNLYSLAIAWGGSGSLGLFTIGTAYSAASIQGSTSALAFTPSTGTWTCINQAQAGGWGNTTGIYLFQRTA